MKVQLALIMLAMIALGGCQEVRNQEAGAVVGGVLGGVLGSQVGGGRGQIAATIAGTMIGTIIGGRVGASMDEADRQRANRSFETTRTGETESWKNPDSGNQYEVTPTKTHGSSERPCRDYTTDAVIDGRKETIRGTACRRSDGTWETI